MSQELVSFTEHKQLWKWLLAPGPPFHVDPPPDWLMKALDNPATFRTYLDVSVNLRVSELQLEIDRLQIMKGIVASLPGPLPGES